MAKKLGIPHWSTDLAESLAQPGVEAAILTTPTPMHAEQAEQCMRAGKHVEVEIPMADKLDAAERLVRIQEETGLVAMVGHTGASIPATRWIHPENFNRGNSRSSRWTCRPIFSDAPISTRRASPGAGPTIFSGITPAHTVDLFQYQTGEVASEAYALQGPMHPKLGIAMDMRSA